MRKWFDYAQRAVGGTPWQRSSEVRDAISRGRLADLLQHGEILDVKIDSEKIPAWNAWRVDVVNVDRNKQNVVVSNLVCEPRLPRAKLTEFLDGLPWIIRLVNAHGVFKFIPKRVPLTTPLTQRRNEEYETL
jgi:hypothetical protein